MHVNMCLQKISLHLHFFIFLSFFISHTRVCTHTHKGWSNAQVDSMCAKYKNRKLRTLKTNIIYIQNKFTEQQVPVVQHLLLPKKVALPVVHFLLFEKTLETAWSAYVEGLHPQQPLFTLFGDEIGWILVFSATETDFRHPPL